MKIILASIALLCSAAFPAMADNYPSKPITYIVPYPPGGAADSGARLLTDAISRRLNQTIIVKNVPGAGGNIALQEAARAKPDGYTLFHGTTATQAVNPSIYKSMSIDPAKVVDAVAFNTIAPNVLVVNPKLNVKTVAELTEYARKNPGKLNMGSSGSGSSIHLSGELYKHLEKLDIVHVPYKGGAAATTDLVGGQIDMMFDNMVTIIPHIRSGAVIPLAVTTSVRSKLLPDVPTMQEAGVTGYESAAWGGVYAPAGTPQAIIDKLNKEIRLIEKDRTFIDKIESNGAMFMPMSREDMDAFVAKERKKWGDLANAINLVAN